MKASDKPHAEHERNLIKQFGCGDRFAFDLLFESNKPRVLRQAIKLVCRNELAQDVVQEVFLRAYLELQHWRYSARLSTWLNVTTFNVAMELLQKETRQTKAPYLQLRKTSPSYEIQEAREIIQELREAVQSLPPRQFEVMSLHYFRGLDFNEIANSMGITSGGAKSISFKARQRLKRELKHRSIN